MFMVVGQLTVSLSRDDNVFTNREWLNGLNIKKCMQSVKCINLSLSKNLLDHLDINLMFWGHFFPEALNISTE